MNNKHLEILKQGVTDWNKWRLDNVSVNPDLISANLTGVDLHGAILSGANLTGAILYGANLYNTNLSDANLTGAYLKSANLYNTNLSDADLSGANLFNTIGNGKEIITFQTETYICNFTKDVLWIGCKSFSYDEWFNFSDEEINKFDTKALEFWTKYKETIFTLKNSYGF